MIVVTLLHRSESCNHFRNTNRYGSCSDIWASVLLEMTLTPMIIATFPILIGLGVDYALHMVNRIESAQRIDAA